MTSPTSSSSTHATPHGVSLLSLGTHWEFHWPSAFVDHSDEVVAFEAHDSEFVVAAELRRPLRPLEPRPLSSSGLRMKPGVPEKQQLRRPPPFPPFVRQFEGKHWGIFYTQTLEVQLAAFFMAWYQEPAFFLKWSFIIVQKEPPKCFLVFNGVADYMGFLKVTIDFRRSVSKRHNQLPALRFDSNLWRNDVFGAFCLL